MHFRCSFEDSSKSCPADCDGLPVFYPLSKDILDEVQDTSDPIKIATQVFDFLQQDAIHWNRAGPFPQPLPVDRFNKGVSNPRFQKMRAYFNRFGYADYRLEFALTLTADFNVTVNMVDHHVDTGTRLHTETQL